MKFVRNPYNKINWLMSALAICLFVACKKDDPARVQIYPDGPKAEVQFLDGIPSPSQGRAGAVVTFKIKGLKGKENKFKFLIGQLESEVLSVADSTVSVRVPADAITGGAAVIFDNQYYFGPEFRVRGDLIIDPTFVGFNGTNGPINDIVNATSELGSYVIAGSFSNYNNQFTLTNPIFDIAKIDKTGNIASSNRFITRAGTGGGTIYSLTRLASGNYLPAGFFTKYNDRTGPNSITRVYQRGQLDTMTVDLVNPDPINNPNDNKDTVATFNGGVNGIIQYAYETAGGQIVAVGSFTEYRSIYYTRSTKASKIPNRVLMNQVLKMNADGSLDSSFNYDLTLHKGKPGPNGPILAAMKISNNRIVLVGAFTNYNGVPARGIVCIDESDGKVSPTFSTGSGPDAPIGTVTFNEKTNKILVTGGFRSFNGIPAGGVVMLNADGSVDESFSIKPVSGGSINYAAQLNSGNIMIAGSFQRYNDKVRPGFAFLDATGVATPAYNTTGTFTGNIYKMLERTTDLGYPGVILVGSFSKFDNTDVRNIVYLEIRK